jgi:lysozyme family protein
MFDDLIDEIIKIEGGYSDDKNDSGGKTRYGITEAVARQYGYQGPMKDLPVSLAKQIYREKYWNPLQLDQIERISPAIVHEMLDTGINQGIGRAGEYLQLSLNALNRQGKDFPDVKIDGDIGPATLGALRAFVTKRDGQGQVVLLRALNCLQGAFYVNLSQNRQKDEEFVYGWLLNRVVI